jgi:large repetitive protein
VGTLYSQTFQATGGVGGPYEWSAALAGGNPLPGWLTMNGSTLSGTPLAAGPLSVIVTARDSNGDAARPLTVNLPVFLPLSISPSTGTLTAGLTDQPYSQALTASGGSGNYSWSITNESVGLNLSLSASTGAAISLIGTPTLQSTNPGFSVTVTLTDTTTGLTLPQVDTIPVTSLLSITSSTSSITATDTGPISASFPASGGTAPYTFSVSAQPPGVSISSVGASGSLSGTPTQAGTFYATITVTDAQNTSTSTPVTINVLGLTTLSLPNGTAGQFYGASVAATGGTGAYSFSASGVPSGLSLSGSGFLSGTAKKGGTYTLSVTVSSGGVSAKGSVSLTMANAQPLSISGASLPSDTINVAYSQTLSAMGGVPPYTWGTSAGSLPQGLTISTSGIVSGTPTGTPGTTYFGVQVTDAAGAIGTATATIVILPIPLVITTQSLPSGMNGVDYPPQTLTANGGVGQYSWTLGSGSSLPSAMVLSSGGVLSGVPGSTGTFSVRITVTDSATPTANTANATFQLTIRPSSADLILTASSLDFSLSNPATNPPSPQTVGVQSTVASQKIGYTLAVSPAVPWLSLSNGATTPDTIQASITSAALTLDAGDYPATITATCTSTFCTGHTQTVAVDLTVTEPPPQLQVNTSLVAFATTAADTGTLSQSIEVGNTGGGTIDITSVACEAAWCSAGPLPAGVGGGSNASIEIAKAEAAGGPSSAGGVGGGSSVSIPVTVNPGLLPPGFYRTQVDIATSAGPGSTAVTLFIAANSTMTLSPQGAQFSMPAGGAPGNPNGSFLVGVNNSTQVNWTASVVAGAGWLDLGTPVGTSSSGAPGIVSYSIDPTGGAALAPGAYYGQIEITSTDVSNSPLDFEVVVNITPADIPVTPNPQPGGLLFITSVGGLLPPQTVTVYSSSSMPSTFQANAATTDGNPWLSVTPGTGPASSGTPGVTLVSVDTTGLNAGIYYGGVSYSLSAAAVVTVSVTVIVTPEPGASSASAASSSSAARFLPRAEGTQAAASCSPSLLVPAQTGLVNSFSAPAGWPTALAIQLYNNCGTVVSNGQVVATFSNGDPPLALTLANPSQGLYSGTWSPGKTSSQVSVTVQASAPGFPAATSKIAGAVVPNAVPVLTPHGTVHSFDPLVGGPLAPGTIVAIYGQYLAAATAQATSVPLPTTFSGSSVVIGGMPAPLYYVSPTQINAQIPFELQPGQQYQVIVSAEGALTTPNSIQLSPATPGLAAFPDGTLIAQHGDGSLVSAASPAKAGEYLVAYLAGMGETTVPVASGAPSPADPLASPLPADSPVLTINGAVYPIYFAGLTPGLVGLYQMNFQVPTGLPAGNITITVSQNEQSSNQTTLPYQP